MPLVKTAELKGYALDYAVALCNGYVVADDYGRPRLARPEGGVLLDPLRRPGFYPSPSFSTDWAQGGPIIEQDYMDISYTGTGEWTARMWAAEGKKHEVTGSTPLIAAMRCHVSSEIGETVDIQEEILDAQH